MHGMSFILADIFMKVEPVNLQSNILVRALFLFLFITALLYVKCSIYRRYKLGPERLRDQ